ncbi:unnamed protein product, partial [Mesorhabditis belari]|uniref:Uncharacterized protein n=1 Tax=Mesorhabditis belari TaxID=2138241 RepID=A0AAF3J7L4_9BILA
MIRQFQHHKHHLTAHRAQSGHDETQKSIRDDETQEKLPGKGAKDSRGKPGSKELLKMRRTKLKKDVSPSAAAPPKGVQIKAKPEFFEELLIWLNEYEMVLTTEKGLIEFGGIEDDNYTRLCSHVKLKNSTHYMLATLYLTLNAPAIPPDAAFSYSIFQLPVSKGRVNWLLKVPNGNDSRLRWFWNEQISYLKPQKKGAQQQYLLRLPVCFLAEKSGCDQRRHRHVVKPIIYVDNQAIAEPDYDTDQQSMKSDQLPSAQG